MSDCQVCCEKDVGVEHYNLDRHKKNVSLREFAKNKSQLQSTKNPVVSITCDVKSSFSAVTGSKEGKVTLSAKPNEEVVFRFSINNVSPNQDVHVAFITLVHSKFNFVLNNHNFQIGCTPQRLPARNKLLEEINVKFSSPNVGQYETSIIFYFQKHINNTKDDIFIMKDLAVYVEASQTVHDTFHSPYARKSVWATSLFRSTQTQNFTDVFPIPKNCKKIYVNGLKDADEAERDLANDIRQIFNTGITKSNYIKFFHNVLWYEETIIRINIKNYNMSGVKLTAQRVRLGTNYELYVPGLAEKRPSLMIGDILYIRPHNQTEVMFEAVVKEINENVALIGGLHAKFLPYYGPDALFDVRFFMSRVPLERMHHAVHGVNSENQESRIFPEENKNTRTIKPIINFFNPLIEDNLEQRCAVERIVAGASGTAPYLLHGPPGTGKTVTIVEAILQLVLNKPQHRIMVCTDSNMAADHVASMLIKYSHMFSKDRLLLRANSQFRIWETLPECLAKYSNGTCRQNFEYVKIEDFMSYSIVVTTLSHAARFARSMKAKSFPHHITHLFIDEAAQASEPACLIPVCGMLKPSGVLVLAGDPHQLGPVVISHAAAKIGLGMSLMERLKKDCPLYSDIRNDPNYIVMLRNNFRSNPDILSIPDQLFYNGQLRAQAKEDEISTIDILGEKQHSRAIVFHGVLSREQKIGKSPSFFNMMECEIVQLYVKRLVTVHNVLMQDIGIVTPYVRQVYQIKKILKDVGYDKIEVGTVEAYQGKEKRIIIISAVRANCNLLDHDARFRLGFLVDDKRFNVAITRAKAKVIIVGNPLCLYKDIKWRMYMQRCREYASYHGFDSLAMDDEGCREIVNNITPLLQGIKISTNPTKPKKKKTKPAPIPQVQVNALSCTPE